MTCVMYSVWYNSPETCNINKIPNDWQGSIPVKKSQGFIVVLALIFMPLLLSLSEAADKGDKISLDCPRLEKKDAQAIVGKVIPDGTVTDVKESPIKGVWQIDIEKEGQHGAIFLDCSRKYLMGQIIPVEAVGRQAPPQKVDVSKIPLDSAILLGAKEAPKKIIVFSDLFTCQNAKSCPSINLVANQSHRQIGLLLLLIDPIQ